MMKWYAPAIAVLLALCVVGSAPSQSAKAKAKAKAKVAAGNVVEGREVFVKSCMACHSVNEGQVLFGPSLYHESTGAHPKKTVAEIKAILKNGQNKMPSFEGKLDDTQMNDVISYIRSL